MGSNTSTSGKYGNLHVETVCMYSVWKMTRGLSGGRRREEKEDNPKRGVKGSEVGDEA